MSIHQLSKEEIQMKTWKFDTWLKDENGKTITMSTGDRVGIHINQNGNYKCGLPGIGGVFKSWDSAQKGILKAYRKWEKSLKESKKCK